MLKGPALPHRAMPGPVMRPEEFTDRYGAATAELQKAARALKGFGLTIDEVAQSESATCMPKLGAGFGRSSAMT